jgi:hypothetical protein
MINSSRSDKDTSEDPEEEPLGPQELSPLASLISIWKEYKSEKKPKNGFL